MTLVAVDSPELEAEVRRARADDSTAADITGLQADERALEELSKDFYVERRITRPEYLAARDGLTERIKAARARLARPAAGAMLRELAGDGGAVRRAWDKGDLEWRRQLVGAVIDRVVIGPASPGASRFDPGRVTVTWRL
jgi:site-specific DNA recombinase